MVCSRLLNSNSWLSELLLWVRIFVPKFTRASLQNTFEITGTVFVTTQPENASVFRPGQVLIVLNVACPVLWIVQVIETPQEVVV
jgi:hypothetical protein